MRSTAAPPASGASGHRRSELAQIQSILARLDGPRVKVIQDRGVTLDDGQVQRRPQWRGERKAVLVRMPVAVADRLARAAREQQRSVSDQAALIIDAALCGDGR